MTKLMRNGKSQKSLIVEKQSAMGYSIKLDLPATGTNGMPIHHGSRGPTLNTLSTKYLTIMMLTPINLNHQSFSFRTTNDASGDDHHTAHGTSRV